MTNTTRQLITPARHLFMNEHEATVEVFHNDQVWQAEAADVSKNHLSIFCEDCSPLEKNEKIDLIKVSIFGQTFEFTQLTMIKRESIQGRKVRLVLRSQKDEDTSRLLWQLSYVLRQNGKANTKVKYDEFTLPKIPARGLYTEDARLERLQYVRDNTDAKLERVAENTFEAKALVSNIEAFIGSVEIPVGIAGPLHIKGGHADGLFYAPMATTEGALLASATRGATALSRSGGVNVRVIGQRMLRVPVFVLIDLNAALFFAEWVKDHYAEIAEQTRKYSNYANLVEVNIELMGRTVHVQFAYETGDAAGQNMTTTCTWQACQWIIAQMQQFADIEFENFMIEANLSNDKKVTYNSFLKGRGVRVLAECLLSDEVCQKVLKVTPKQLFTAYNQFIGGSIASGMIGMNINIANVIGAIFTATGQDIACVHESSIGQLYLELTDDNEVYATLRLPSLVVGSVGGGTSLAQQKECLELIGCAGPGCSHKLAEVIAGFCLALDLSTLSAIASDQFARAHEKLGRNRPVEFLKLGDLNSDFFTRAMQSYNQHHGFEVEEVLVEGINQIQLESKGSSIITELTAHKINKLVGHYPFELKLAGVSESKKVMVKVKPLDDEVILMLNSMASMCDARLAHAYNEFKNGIGFKGCHIRELKVMSQTDERFVKNTPTTYFAWQDESREAYVIVQELMENMELMDSADDTSGWTEEHIHVAIRGIAEVHSIWFEREDELAEKDWIIDAPTAANMVEKTRLWEMLVAHSSEEFPEWLSENDLNRFRDLLYSMKDWYSEIDAMPKTLIHNDFNPRNIAFRRHALLEGQEKAVLSLCAYDWELATINIPQHDLAELLVFTLQPDFNPADVEAYIELHRIEFEVLINKPIDATQWRRGFTLSLWDLVINRFPMYAMAHTFRHYGFMDRTQATFRNLLDNENARMLALEEK
ncbi:MAG: hydroxymethylglutaryl-CoA reductase (NADPH) [Oleispira sp.]|jgi:hydroxymethylglutaryl-CoA reductase (NADPH)